MNWIKGVPTTAGWYLVQERVGMTDIHRLGKHVLWFNPDSIDKWYYEDHEESMVHKKSKPYALQNRISYHIPVDVIPRQDGTYINSPFTVDMLPSWDDCDTAVRNHNATPLQAFIHEQEPAGEADKAFRRSLVKVINSMRGTQ